MQRVLNFPRPPAKLRLLFLTGSLPHGGAERHAIALLDELARRGHECHAACVKPASDALTGISRATTPHSLGAAKYLDRRAVDELAGLITRTRPHAIVAANAYALMYATLARRRARHACRVVVTWHTTKLLSVKEQLQMLLYRLLFWNADCTVFLCRRQQRYWRWRGLFSRDNEVIHNGIDLEAFRDRSSVAQRQQLRWRLGWRPADYVIGIPALLRPEKNHLQLLDAVARLRQQGIAACALLIGDGPLRGAIEQRSRALGLTGAVTITGLQQDVRPWLAACDVVTLCSVTETFSLAALEAMAMGRPVVLSDVGGAAEMVEAGRNGLLFPARDTPAFVNCLTTLSDPAVAHRMGGHARDLVEQRFSAKTMVDRYEHLLARLCRAGGRTAATVAPTADRRTSRG